MNPLRFIFTAALLSGALLGSGCAPQVRPEQGPALLLVGDSELTRHDIAGIVQALLEAQGAPLARVDTLLEPGFSLRDHLLSGRLERLLSARSFDVVVLVDRRSYPLCSVRDPDCADAPVALADAVKRVRSSGARALWLSTYQVYPPVQQILSARARALAASLDLDLADLGQAMLRYTMRGGPPPLMSADAKLDANGAWLAALAIVAALERAPLEGIYIESLCRASTQRSAVHDCTAPSAEAQRAALKAVSD